MEDLTDAPAIPVLSGDGRLLDLLFSLRGKGSVHSVFTRVVNLLAPGGTLIALAARGSGDAPRTLVADVADWSAYQLDAGLDVTFATGNIALDRSPAPRPPLRLATAGARAWHPAAPSLAPLPPGALAGAADAVARICRVHGPLGGMLGARPGAGPMEAAVVRALHAGRDLLLAGLRTGDRERTRDGVLALLGLGPGLTPAGDDFLTGLVLVAALPGSRLDGFPPLLRDLLADRGDRTTALSLATLSEAAEGRVRSELLRLVALLAHGNPTAAGPGGGPRSGELHASVREVLAIGHSSGGDLLSGLAAGLRLEEELRGPL
ncbi:oxamate carbamoyltransferase subunit AllH family protein [Streptomyces termitum]|uniref:oxamate carbamoyltransferase subunit AllH family protein n=1 Tax=Streptomyces termitum TaxID=67368 RepID=UPI0033B6F090